jgi:hypothetical protein
MIPATLDLAFQLPAVKPMEKPMAFTAAQLQRMIAWGNAHARDGCPSMQRILERVEDLRGSSITWALGLTLGDLVTWSVKVARGSVASLSAPITFFKPEGFLWIPKVIVRVFRDFEIDPADLTAYHTTCRRASIEFMAITQEQIEDGYLDRKDFKRAFNGAFFCDRLRNTSIFCPTLRDWGFHSWTEAGEPIPASAR